MKKILFLTIALLLVHSGIARADQPLPPPPPPLPPGEIVILPIDPPGKPRSTRFENEVSAYINSSVLNIVFGASEGIVDITIIDAAGSVFYEGTHLSSSAISVDMTGCSIPAEIYITTSYGNEYEGWIE